MTKPANKTATGANNRALYNLEAEMMIIGCLFIDEGKGDVSDRIISEIKENDFKSEANKILFSTAKILYNKGVSIDPVTIAESLERAGNMGEIGGIKYICDITSLCFSNANYQHYLDILKDLSGLRQLQEAGKTIDALAGSGKTKAAVMSEAERLITAIAEESINNDIEHIEEASKVEIERLKRVMDGVYDDFGIGTGYQTLDRVLWGLQKSDMITIAARPGVGKSAFALNVAKAAAVDQKKKVIFFSLEMPKTQQIQRLYSLISGIESYTLKSGKGLKEQRNELNIAAQAIKESGLYIDDQSNLTVSEMLAKARRFKRKCGLDLVIVDYLQFVKPGRILNNRANEVGEIARDIKNMARQLNVPVVVLAQLNREQDVSDRLPVLRDLRESGEIENNSDIVIFLHSRSGKDIPVKNIDLIIGKFRNGQMKNIAFTYTGNLFKFEEVQTADNKQKSAPPRQERISSLIPIN